MKGNRNIIIKIIVAIISKKRRLNAEINGSNKNAHIRELYLSRAIVTPRG